MFSWNAILDEGAGQHAGRQIHERGEVPDDEDWGRNRTRDVVESGQVTKGLPEEVK